MNFGRFLSIHPAFSGCLLVFAFLAQPAFANSNYFLEKQISRSLAQTEKKENILWLKTTEKPPILALLAPANTLEKQGGVIILADLFQSPDWPIIIHGLRTKLPDYGWETLSIQLPIPVYDISNAELNSTYELTRQRINSAIDYFKTNNISNIVLIGVGQSANFALKYVATLPVKDPKIQAIVSIKAYDSRWLTSSELVKKISIPLFDIIPEHDADIVLNSAKKRLIAANFAGKLKTNPRMLALSSKVQTLAINKTGNLRYRQKVINGANYHFDEQEYTLIKAIRGWLGVYASGKQIEIE